MDGLKFSQELTKRNVIRPEETRNIETLINTMTNAGGEVSDRALQQICSFLDKVCRSFQEVDYELLQRIFKCLQTWSLSPALSRLLQNGIVQILAKIYDNLMQSDYSRSDVLESVLELLFVVEDMSDSIEGKIQCGKIFLFRLLALATTKLPSVKLHRAAAETICALVTKSPDNQQAVLDEMANCHKLFKTFLPKCGDFQLQASITEIFYRLAKKGPQLLEFVQDKIVRRSMVSLVQSKKPDLLSEIRTIVMLLNESLGPLRSVYSFLAEEIVINGRKMITNEKWVNFGRTQLSFYILPGLADSDIEGPSMMDVQYDDIMELKRSSATLLEISVQEKPGLSSFNKALELGSGKSASKFVQIQMYFTPGDLSAIEATVSTKLSTQSIREQVIMGSNGDSETVDKSKSKVSKDEFGLCKSSTGISLALSRKHKTPNNQAGGQALQRSVEADIGIVSPAVPPNPSNCKSPRRNNIHPQSNEIWPGDAQLSKRVENRGRMENLTLEYIHSASEFVLETPQDRETLSEARVSVAPEKDLTLDRIDLQISRGRHTASDALENSKQSEKGGEEHGRPQVASVSTTSHRRFNTHNAAEQSFPQYFRSPGQEERQLIGKTMAVEPVHDCQSWKLLNPRIDSSAAAVKQTHGVLTAVSDDNKTCKGQRTSEPSQLHKQTQQKLSTGPKTKSQSAAMVCARVTDSHDQAVAHELRTKQRLDSQQIHITESEVPTNVGVVKPVSNAGRLTTDAGFDEYEKSPEFSDKNLITPPRDMSNGRKKPVTGRGAKRCYRKSVTIVQDRNTVLAEVGAKNVSRTLKTRECKKKFTNYSELDSDDGFSSAASEGLSEFEGSGPKRSKVEISDRVVKAIDSAEHRTVHVIAKCNTSTTAQQKHRPGTDCDRNHVMVDQHLHRHDKKAATISVGKKKNCSATAQAAHEQKVVCALNSEKKVVEDKFCFSAGLAVEPVSSKTSLELNCKVGRDLSHGEPSAKGRKMTAPKSCNQLRNTRQESCTSDWPRPVIPDASTVQIINLSTPGSSPAGSTPPKQKDDMPKPQRQHDGGRGVPCELSDDISRSPNLQVQKTRTEIDKVVQKRSKMERWKSFNISKLELPKVDTASTDESSDKPTVGSSPGRPHATVLELEDAGIDCEDGSGIGMIASLLRSFKRKVKLEEKRMVEEILSSTMQRLQNEIQSAEERVQRQKTEFGEVCKRKCGKLNDQVQGQTRKMRVIYENFQQDFAAHLQQHEKIVAGMEETEAELSDLAKQQAQAQQVVLAQLQELCKHHLAEADQKILAVEKSSKGMHGLKDALRGVLDL